MSVGVTSTLRVGYFGVRVPAGARDISKTSLVALGPTQLSVRCLPSVKWREIGNPSLSSDEVRYKWRYTSASRTCLHGVYGTPVTFSPLHKYSCIRLWVAKRGESYSIHIDDSFPIHDSGTYCVCVCVCGANNWATWREDLTAHRIPVDSFQAKHESCVTS